HRNCRPAEGQDLGVGRGIARRLPFVAGGPEHPLAGDDDGPDRDLPGQPGLPRLGQGEAHGVQVVHLGKAPPPGPPAAPPPPPPPPRPAARRPPPPGPPAPPPRRPPPRRPAGRRPAAPPPGRSAALFFSAPTRSPGRSHTDPRRRESGADEHRPLRVTD